jgi:outer membrane protein assembly factor BamB
MEFVDRPGITRAKTKRTTMQYMKVSRSTVWMSGLRLSRVTVLAVLAAAMAVGASADAFAQAGAAERTCEVTCLVIGAETLPSDAALGQGFGEALEARPGFSVKGVKAGASLWTPGGTTAGAEPVTVVSVSVGKYRELLALVADEKGTTMLAALRRECQVIRKNRRDWAGPGPFQIPENAARELAQDFGHLQTAGLKADDAKRVLINVIPWKTVGTDLAGGFTEAPTAGGKAVAAVPMEPSGGANLAVANALAIAAMAQAGAQPTNQNVPTTLTIEMAQNIDHYALRYTLKRDGKTQRQVHRFIAQAELFEHIAVAGHKLWTWGDDVRSTAKVGDGPAEPLAAGNGVVVLGVGGVIRGVEPVSGNDLWPALAVKRVAFPYAVVNVGTENKVIRMARPPEAVDIQSGKFSLLTGDAPALPWAIDVSAKGRTAIVIDSTVFLSDGAKELWKTTLTDPITAGPALSDRALFVASETGEVIALSTADGSQMWRKPTGLRLVGPATLVGDSLIVCAIDGTVLAMVPGDGSVIWKHPGKDILLTRPCLVDGLLLLTDKGNTIWLLDPKTGQTKASYGSDTWLTNVVPIESAGQKWVVASDIQGVVRFLTLPSLKPQREVALAGQLSKAILLVPQLPSEWASGNDIDVKSPGVLLGDRRGWIYVLNLPGK